MKLFASCLVLCAMCISQVQMQDSPEVAAAKAAHFEAVRRAELVIANAPAPAPASIDRYQQQQQKPAVVETDQHKLGLNVHDTPEVAAAKVAHYEAVRDAEYATAKANATNQVSEPNHIGVLPMPRSSSGHHRQPVHYPSHMNYPSPSHHYNPHHPAPSYYPDHHYRPTHYPSTGHPHHHHRSLPIMETSQHQLGINVHDTPEVAAARAAHFDAVRRAEQLSAVSGSSDDGSYMMVHRYQEPAPIIPVSPVVHGSVYIRDTPEVAAAKAAHLEAVRRAEMTAGPRFVDQYAPMAHQAMYMPAVYAHIGYNRMNLAVPQTNQHKLGMNVHDTPEVAASKAAHFEAVRQAQLLAAENERKYSTSFVAPNNNYNSNPTREYGQVKSWA